MPIGNPVTLTSNVASKAISVTATASQTLFNVTGGYRINELGVFKNGLRLQDGVDYTARDGLTVTLLSAASGGDKLQFVVFDTFRVAEAIRPSVDEQTIRGNLNVVGILSCTDLEGPVSLNITSGIQTFNDVRVGGALTVAGTLTYEDTTNTNTTGIATFSGGMNISGVGATVTTLNVTGVSTIANLGNVSIADSIYHVGDSDTSFGFPAADTFNIITAGSEALRVDSSQRLLLGATSARGIGHGTAAAFEIEGTSATVFASVVKNSNDQYGSSISLGKTRGTSIGDNTSVNSGDEIGSIRFAAADGTDVQTRAAQITAAVDGTPASNDMPGRLIFSTTPEGAAAPTEKLRITSDGKVCIGSASDEDLEFGTDANAILQLSTASAPKLILCRDDTSVVTNDYLGIIDFHSRDGGIKRVARIGARAGGNHGSDDGPTDLVFHTMGDNTATSAEERLRITFDGNVGINSTSPGSVLSVGGDMGLYRSGTQHGTYYIYKDNVATAWFKYRGDTNVVIIGNNADDRLTINPSGGLNVAGITTATQLFEGTTRVATTGKAIAMAMLFG